MIDRTIKTFGEPVVLINRSTGYRDNRGEWQSVADTRTDTFASTEPMSAESIEQIPAGARASDWRVFYIDGDLQVSVGDDKTADAIEYRGENWRVSEVYHWGEYMKILAVRITE